MRPLTLLVFFLWTLSASFAQKVPNVFSPNNDGVNDLFSVEEDSSAGLTGEIFDRWGHRLYRWEGVRGSWDGRTSSGVPVPEGVYFYIIELRSAAETQKKTLTGWVMILR